MWDMNMISDTYQPCFTAALHIATELLGDGFIKREARSCAETLEGNFQDDISGSKKVFAIQHSIFVMFSLFNHVAPTWLKKQTKNYDPLW